MAKKWSLRRQKRDKSPRRLAGCSRKPVMKTAAFAAPGVQPLVRNVVTQNVPDIQVSEWISYASVQLDKQEFVPMSFF